MIRKISILLVCCLLIASKAFADVSVDIPENHSILGAALSPDGAYILDGFMSTDGESMRFVRKIDEHGNILWENAFDTMYMTGAIGFAYVLANGSTWLTMIGNSPGTLHPHGRQQFILISPDGHVLAQTDMPAGTQAVHCDGQFLYAIGAFDGADDPFSDAYDASLLCVRQMDMDGNEIWTQSIKALLSLEDPHAGIFQWYAAQDGALLHCRNMGNMPDQLMRIDEGGHISLVHQSKPNANWDKIHALADGSILFIGRTQISEGGNSARVYKHTIERMQADGTVVMETVLPFDLDAFMFDVLSTDDGYRLIYLLDDMVYMRVEADRPPSLHPKAPMILQMDEQGDLVASYTINADFMALALSFVHPAPEINTVHFTKTYGDGAHSFEIMPLDTLLAYIDEV